jgi:hypothetical protein
MFSQNNYQQVFVGAKVNLTDATSTGANIAGLNAGEIGIFTPSMKRYVESGASTNEVNAVAGLKFVIGLKTSDGKPLVSDVIDLSKVTKVTRKLGSAGAEQVSVIGYNGTSGSIAAENDNLYTVRLNFKGGFTNNNHGTEYIKHAVYRSDATANQAEIATALTASGIYNMSREPKNSSGQPPVKFKAVSNVALASDFVFDATFEISGVNGSDTLLSAAATPTYDTVTPLAVGDYLRIGTAAGATGGAVALLSDVYRVVALPSTTTIKLDRPLQTATGQYTIAAGAITVIPAATAIAANWGIVMTAQAQDFVANPTQGVLKQYEKINWVTSLDGFGATPVAVATAYSLGVNTFEQIAALEIFARGNNGETFRTGSPVQYAWTQQTLSASAPFATIDIEYTDETNHLVGHAKSPKVVTLAIPYSSATGANYAVTGTGNDITDVLEILLTGAVDGNGGLIGSGDLSI